MPSTLTWIDHDPIARERSLRILALFQERESRDELGLGAIRDSFSDALFPGTSTIQTRLRYMLFIPWIYKYLEEKREKPPAFGVKARKLEVSLVGPLIESSDHAGVFGKRAGKGLRRLPSSVYWNGLGVWGIRKTDLSQDEYHRYVDAFYKKWDASHRHHENDDPVETDALSWRKLPNPPAGFPDEVTGLSLQLEEKEAGFLRDCLYKTQKGSLLTHLAWNCQPVECEFPWEHPEKDRFHPEHMELLNYAEFFSVLMHGAGFLYNLMLAEQAERKELIEEHRENLEDWKSRFQGCPNKDLQLEGLWKIAAGRGHTITHRTKEFVQAWHRRILESQGDVGNDTECRTLVNRREQQLKGPRSRFTNPRARDQWKGYAGVNQLSYRWPNVKVLLSDLYSGLNKDNNAES